MTVCIAALCDDRKQVVIVCDSKASFGDYSADDLLLKVDRVGRNTYVLFSGNDITDLPFIFNDAKDELKDRGSVAPHIAARIIHESMVRRRHEQITAKVLSPFGLTKETFLRDGKALLTESIFDGLCEKIASVNLPITVLLVSFDEAADAHIFSITGDAAPNDYTAVGFCAVGSGSYSAFSSLLFRSDRDLLGPYCSRDTCIYCCCEAKFMSKSASDVGKSTFLAVLSAEKSPAFIASHRIDQEIKRNWEKHGAPRVHMRTVRRIPQMLFSWDQGSPHPIDVWIGDKKKVPHDKRALGEHKSFSRAFDLARGGPVNFQPPKDDPSLPPPLPESPGGSGES
jgi:20S proteasome alpha/beta subunit